MDGDRQKFGLHGSIGFFTTKAARLIERRVEESLRAHGLTRLGWCTLLAVAEENLKYPSEIAEFIGIDRTATSRILRSLEGDGLIARSIGKTDRRMTEVEITDAGQERLMQARPICQENLAHFDAKLSLDELEELKRLLEKLCSNEGDFIAK